MATFRPPGGYPLMIGIVLATLATAIIHFFIGGPLFVLNGIGYLGLLALMYVPLSPVRPLQPFVRYILIGYTALTIILYFVFGPPFDALGLTTKAIEALLIVALVIEASRARGAVPAD